MLFFFFFKQKTAYEMRISDWSSDVCSSDLRLAACRREVELNRRLSPDVYLGVADVLDAAGEPCEHVVVMRRMPADRRLSTLVLEGAPVEEALDDLAAMIARFHATAERSPEADRAAGRDALPGRGAATTAGPATFAGRFLAPRAGATGTERAP